VLPPDDPAHSAKVRIFIVTQEQPFAGHPNIGTGFVLAQQKHDGADVLLFEEWAGLVEVRIERAPDGTEAGATVPAPQALSLGETLPPDPVADCAGLQPSDILLQAHPPVLASVGTPFLLAEVGAKALSRAAPDPAAFRRTLERFPALNGGLNLYLYARDHEANGDGTIQTRMFSPLVGAW
jgi:trans-2,3-dihydro-3-hydroxyanthranilate isomerase